MREDRSMKLVVGTWLVALTLAGAPASAQTVGNEDIFALQDALYDASRDVALARPADPGLAQQLQRDLDAVRDEVVYLRVKLRKEGSVSRAEYNKLRDRVEDIRVRAKGESGPVPAGSIGPGPISESPSSTAGASRPSGYATDAPPPAYEPRPGSGYVDAPMPVRRPDGCGPYDVCTGQELDVRLQTTLNSDTAQVEDRFDATTLVPFYNENHELIPAGSLLTGVVSAVDRAGRLDRKGSISLAFEKLVVRGVTYDIRAMVSQAIESRGMKTEVAKITAGAGMGAMIGGVIGGVGGAIAGMAIGGGGILLATEGSDVKVPAGTVLRIRFDAPVTIR
jgi:hypothetical protein